MLLRSLTALIPVCLICAAAPATRKAGPGQRYATPCQAFAAASDGDTIEIDAKGTYSGDVCAITRHRLTIRGTNGRPRIDAAGKSSGGKAIWVVQGNDTTIENIEFTGAKVTDQNGAGIRLEGRNLTIRNCHFHHNENGILTGPVGGAVTIEHSEFAYNGFGDGYSHNMYIGEVDRFVLRGSYSHHSNVGNLVKSRARVNIIAYNRISQENGNGSWELDIANAGEALVIGNIIQQGPEATNSNVLSFGLEGAKATHPPAKLLLAHNTFVNTRPSARFLLIAPSMEAAVEARNNIFAGPGATGLTAAMTQAANIQDPGLTFENPTAYDFRLKPASPAVNAATTPGTWDAAPVVLNLQYAHPMCLSTRTAVGTPDAGAFEYGLTPSAPRCGGPQAAMPSLAALDLAAPSAAPGASTQATVRLTSPAPAAGVPIAVRSTWDAVTVPPTVLVNEGDSSASFAAQVSPAAKEGETWIVATLGEVEKAARLTITALAGQPPKLLSFTSQSRFVRAGATIPLTLTLDRPAPSSGATVSITASPPGFLTLPPSITVPAGATSTTFQPQTPPVPFALPILLTARSANSVNLVLWLLPSTDTGPNTPRSN